MDGSYCPGNYVNFYIHDPKKRIISAAQFRDRVVHHALVNLIESIFEEKLIYDTYANRIGKGTHRALDRCTHFMRRFRYVLPLDIVQYFPSISHSSLFDLLKLDIDDPQVLQLCKLILDSGKHISVQNSMPVIHQLADEINLDGHYGLPIGNLTSQFWANVYLNPVDQFIKRVIHCPGYIRYVDDMLLFSDNKEELASWKTVIEQHLFDYHLYIHTGSAQPRPVKNGIPFLGFHVYPDHRRLKRNKKIIARRRFKRMMISYKKGEISQSKVKEKVIAWLNHASYGDTWNLRQDLMENIHI